MWIVGTVLLVVIAWLLMYFIARHAPLEKKRAIWDIPRSAGTYTSIVGTLAGFAVASSFFLANLVRVTGSPELETVIGMLIIGFLVLIGTAMTYATTPNYAGIPISSTGDPSDDKFMVVQRLTFILGHTSYYLGIVLTWLSLRPLTIAMGLNNLAAILTWILLLVVVAGAVRMTMYFYSLTEVSRLTAAFVPVVGLGLASIYRLVLVPILPMLWPPHNPSLAYVVVAFVLAFIGFLAGSLLIYRLANLAKMPNLERHGEEFLFCQMEAAVCITSLLWFSVAFPQ